ncbi:MAG: hypothetical protein KJ645_12515 [Planctomycetes bacterium]|nr:hypothetical protein [Planctomycetota bacterium]
MGDPIRANSCNPKRRRLLDIERLKNPRGVTSPRETLKLFVLAVLATIVVGAYFFFDYHARMQREEAEIDPESYMEVPAGKRQPGANIDFELLKEVRDDEIAERVVKEKEPFLHLVQQAARLVYGDMELLGLTRAVPEEIKADPAAHRGHPYEVIGTLSWLEEITDHDPALFRGFITTPDGEICYFTVLNHSYGIALGDVVKLQGFFFKIFSFNLPGDEERVSDAIFLIGKRLIPSFFEMAPVHELDMGLLDNIRDYDILDMAKPPFEEKAFYHMLSYVSNLSEEERASLKYQEIIPPDILRKPFLFRGQPIQTLGEIVVPPMERDLGPKGENPLGIKRCYHGVLLNYSGGKFGFVYFLTLNKPDWMVNKDLVYLRGIFLQNYAYRTQNENLQPAPLVVVTEFEKFVLPKDNTIAQISMVILAGTIVLSLFFLFQIFKDRKYNRDYRDKFIARKKKQVQAMVKDGAFEDSPQSRKIADHPDRD